MNKFCIIGFGKLGLLHACITNKYKNYKLSLIIEKNFWIRIFLRFILKNVTIAKNLSKKKLANIKLVIIATQPSQTGNILYQLKNCYYKNKILIEKPSFISLQDFYNNKYLLNFFTEIKIGYMYRENEIFTHLKKIINKKIYGNPIKISAYVFSYQPLNENKTWRKDKKEIGGGAVMLQGTHMIDLLLYIFSNIYYVKSKNYYSKDRLEYKSIALFKTENNSKIELEINSKKKGVRKMSIGMKVFFKKYLIEADDESIKIFKKKKLIFENYKNQISKSCFFEIGDSSYSKQLNNFLKRKNNKINEIRMLEKNLNLINKIYNNGNNFRSQ
jgi:hypothetical protein